MQQGPGVDVGALADRVRAALPGSGPLERAELVDAVARAVYDYVKFQAPEGGGLDGREGPERAALGRVVDAAEAHLAALHAAALREPAAGSRPFRVVEPRMPEGG